jgi:predicted ATPase/DNA-binding SARP family transcriptional activator/DNA-binding CsgD family transcriptional regulator
MSERVHGSVGKRADAVRIRMLGGFRVSVGHQTVRQDSWRMRKAASLVKLLALAPRHHVHREQAMETLWPELGRRAASNNLRQALYAARKALDPDPLIGSRYLASEDELLALCPEGQLWVDSEAFEEAARNARRSREPEAYEGALDLYAGELLPADRYEEWAEEPRRQLRETHLFLLLGLARLWEERGEYDLATETLRRALTEEPTLEKAHAGLMRLYALAGSKGEALAQYSRLEEAFSRELGTEPSHSSRALREEIVVDRFPPKDVLPFGSPAEEPPTSRKHNLPAPRTIFVGREREMLEVKRALTMTRLLTLTGAGGSGKTRVALEVARDLVGAYPEGVWLVELAPLADSELAPQAVASAVGVKEQPGEALVDTLARTLRTKQTLLVLDNCEHLVEGAALVANSLLDSCPHLRVLATSREALGVAGEIRWTVPPLSAPDPRGADTVEELKGFESARLFAERASEKRPGFRLTPENARAVGQICHRLEGIPLAIELAAARVATLSTEQISERITESLKLLTSSTKTQMPKQRTLSGALDWSHKLLSEDEKQLFGRLSVFARGWTLEAAEAVGAGAGLEQDDIVEVLSGLVDKSLVVAEASEGGGVRYRMLEPIRQYASEKLKEGSEGDEVRRRHAGFFLALAEEAEPRLRTPEDREWLELLEREHDNLRAALSWALERGEVDLALRLAGALGMFWFTQGYLGEGREWLETALAKGGQPTSATPRAKVLEALFWLTYDQWDLDRAEAVAQEGFELSKEAEAEAILAASFRTMLAGPTWVRGNYERARELLEESIALSRKVDDKIKLADALFELALATYTHGDYMRAKEIYEEGIVVCQEAGYTYLLPAFLLSLGYLLMLEGDYRRGEALNEEATALFREHGYKGRLQFALNNLGWAALLRGEREQARTLYEECLRLCNELGDRLNAALSLEGLACVAGAKGEAERAVKLFGAAEALEEGLGAVAYRLTPEEDAWREPYRATARSGLDETSWKEAWAEGRAMSMEQAIEFALSDEGSRPSEPSADELSASLTRREKDVAALVARGLTNGQIAKELFISERTVDHHVEKILKKLNLPSRELVASRLTEYPPNPG